MSQRLFIVSNRLPVTIRVERQQPVVQLSAGGLATGLRCFHDNTETIWLGWPGNNEPLDDKQRRLVTRQLAELRAIPIYLSAKDVSGFYAGFSNSVLWPLFHYLLDKVQIDAHREWKAYCRVNQQFADTIVSQNVGDDLLWIHDYQLLLAPEMVRRREPSARIGFFLHIPFPAMEVFRILPWRETLLRGLLGADLIGFHADSYRAHFIDSVDKILGIRGSEHELMYDGRTVRLGVYPMGIDSDRFGVLANSADVVTELARIKSEYQNRRLILAVDRLDYTKGIPRRLLAIEKLLQQTPSDRIDFRFLQVAVPSRTMVDSYAQFRRQIEEMIGRINGIYSHVNLVPIHYLYRSISDTLLTALYRAADVILVTPLRDGLNLVAKEYVASRTDQDGVLVLSEFAGAADQLPEALIVNPHDVKGVAATIRQALAMSVAEQRERMRTLRQRVAAENVFQWGSRFVGDLGNVRDNNGRGHALLVSSVSTVDGAVQRMREADSLTLILDYDGTLVPFADTPEEAAPDLPLMELLATLSRRPRTELHLISGRPCPDLDAWFGKLAIGLHAEHGFWSRLPAADSWTSNHHCSLEWKEQARTLIQPFLETCPGSLMEEKHSGLAWHYRQLPAAVGEEKARELIALLARTLSGEHIDVCRGNKVIELRAAGVHKGIIVDGLAAKLPASLLVAIGDDVTDEDLFRHLPPGQIAIHVGDGPSVARYRLVDHHVVRRLLSSLTCS